MNDLTVTCLATGDDTPADNQADARAVVVSCTCGGPHLIHNDRDEGDEP